MRDGPSGAEALVLVLTDDRRGRLAVVEALRAEGYEVEVVEPGRALEIVASCGPDALVVDAPSSRRIDGCRRLRELTSAAIVVLGEPAGGDAAECLDQGADDYVAHPERPREIAARVRARLRRAPPTGPRRVLTVGHLSSGCGGRPSRSAPTPCRRRWPACAPPSGTRRWRHGSGRCPAWVIPFGGDAGGFVAMKVGVDLGGTKIFAIATDDGKVVGEMKAKTPVLGGPLAVVDAIVSVVRELGDGAPLETVGVGAPGAVDVATGEVRRAPNLKGWMEPFPLGPTLAEALGGVDVVVDNDVNVGTVAEHQLGAAVGSPNVMGLFVGTGVGAGLILDGQLRRGPTGFAGEIGHVVVRPGGRRCGCGGRGHLEAYAGRAGMERRARQHHARGMDTVLVEWSKARRMTSSVFARALEARDRVAVGLIDRAVETLGQAVATAVTLLDVPLVVVGGGLADRLGPPFIQRIEQASLAAMPSGQADTLRVVPGALGDRGGALGAAVAGGASISPAAAGAAVT